MVRTGSLFSQILALFQRPDFVGHVRALKAEYRAKGFTCWEQFVAMLFCQLAQARSLREITDGLQCCEGKLKHLGLAQGPKRSTLANVISKAANLETNVETLMGEEYGQFLEYVPQVKRLQHLYAGYKKENQLMDYDDLILFFRELTAH